MLKARRLAFRHSLRREGFPATFTHGATEIRLDVLVTQAQSENISLGGGASIQSDNYDILCEHDALEDADGNFVEPSRGDTFVLDAGPQYEVKAGGEGAWRWSDGTRTFIRIHVRLKGE